MEREFECDKEYPWGTVVCLGSDGKLTQCTHDNCPFALVISFDASPGDGFEYYVALGSTVDARTAQDLPIKVLVVSDGRGGVRAQQSGEYGFSMGYTTSPTFKDGDGFVKVSIMIHPLFCILK